MDLTLGGDEEQIVSAASGFLTKALPANRLHAERSERFNEELRASFAELGWFGLGLPEDLGGVGFTAVEEMLIFREIGRNLAPTGILGVTLGARIAALAGRADLAASLMAGEESVAILVREGTCDVGDASLSGRFRLYDWEGARFGVLVDADAARLVDLSGVSVAGISCLDRNIALGTADLATAPVVAFATGPETQRVGRLAVAAMLVGIAEAVLVMVTEYATIRQTFGRPIGSYQGVRHPLAEMAVRTEVARCQLFLAAVASRDALDAMDLQVDAAKLLANGAAIKNVDDNIQYHGGIGITDEHDAHLFMKRAQVLARWFGGDKLLLDRILRANVPA